MRIRRWIAGLGALALVALLASLASCGGGSTVAINGGVGTGGTGISTGTVTGFGSVVLDGTPYNSASSLYYAGTDQDAEEQTTSTAVGLGDRLEIRLDANGQPTKVVIDPELMGPVSDLSANGFTINGVRVQINTNPAAGPITYYSGLNGFSSLSNGMQLEVHGAFGLDSSGQGYVQATRIEQLPSSNPVTRLTGLVTHLDGASNIFQIGNRTVQFSAATQISPAGQALANGQLVNVWSNVPPTANGVILAGAIGVRTLQGSSGQTQIGGLVAQLTGNHFTVSGIPVDASAPTLVSAVQGLFNGAYVVVQGNAIATTGMLVATGLRAYAVDPSQVELRGTITGFVSPGNFLVRGVPVDASSANVVFSNGSAASLRNGAFVDVVGHLAAGPGNVVTASSVNVHGAAPEGSTVDYQGSVSAVNLASGVFTLTAVDDGVTQTFQVTLAPNVVFSNGSQAQLINGANVEVEATKTAAGLQAYTVSYQGVADASDGGDGASTPMFETQGILYNLNTTSFEVNALTIQINNVVPKGGTLANGAKVEVRFTQSGGQNLAQAISVD